MYRAMGASGLAFLKPAPRQAFLGVIQQHPAFRTQALRLAVTISAINPNHGGDRPDLPPNSRAAQRQAGMTIGSTGESQSRPRPVAARGDHTGFLFNDHRIYVHE
jgi:hypothetical protein